MNFLAHSGAFALAHITFWIFLSLLQCSSAFYSPRQTRCSTISTISSHDPLNHFRFAMASGSFEDDGMQSTTSTQDVRSFLTQRCIQSFMYLLASTRDLHTVAWLDNFTQPITINLYDWDIDEEAKPVSINFFSTRLQHHTQGFSFKL